MTDFNTASAPETGIPGGAQPQTGAADSVTGGREAFSGGVPQGAGYVVNPATGQLYFQVPVQPGPDTYSAPSEAAGAQAGAAGPGVAPDPAMAQETSAGTVPPGAVPPGAVPPGATYQEVPPSPGPDYSEVIKSVEQFAEGEATVGDVVKTLYTNTAQDDQFWKGALVGAAAAVLLTSGPVKETMGKTFGGLFGGQTKAGAGAAGAGAADGAAGAASAEAAGGNASDMGKEAGKKTADKAAPSSEDKKE